MVSRLTHQVVRAVAVVLGVTLLAACGADSGSSSPPVPSRDVWPVHTGGLDDPPFGLDGAVTVAAIDDDRLFVLSDSRAAVFSFARAEWRTLPDAPFHAPVTSVGDTVLVIGPRCDGKRCDADDETATVVGAALDLTGGGGWHERELDLPTVNPNDFGFVASGQVGSEQLLVLFGLQAISADLTMRTIESPQPGPRPYPYLTCSGAGHVEALVTYPQRDDAMSTFVGIGPEFGNGLVARTDSLRPARWRLLPESSTAALPAPATTVPVPGDPSASSALASTCTGAGMLLTNVSQTLVWDGRAWSVLGPPPPGTFMQMGAAHTADGAVAAPTADGHVSVFRDGAWTTVAVAPGAVPRVVALAGVGNRIVGVVPAEAARSRRLVEIDS